MNSAYLFALLLAGGYVGSRFIFSRLRITGESQHLFLLGGEYLLLGYLLGPSVLNILSETVIDDFAPIIVVGIGWLGLLLGNQLAFQHLRRFSSSLYKLLLLENVFFMLIFGGIFWFISQVVPGFGIPGDNVVFWVFLASMTATSPTALYIMSRSLRLPLRVTLILRFLSSFEGLFGVLLLGVIYSAVHPSSLLFTAHLKGLQWLLLSILLGVLGGLFFHLMIRECSNDFETVLVILGVVIYIGGMAYYLNVSALFVAFVIGLVMANLSHAQIRINQILAKTEKPFFIVFLIFAGALWRFQDWRLLYIAPVLFGLRALTKQMATAFATRLEPNYRQKPLTMGLGLASVSGLGLAIALEFYLLRPESQAGWLLNVVILMVFINLVITPLLLKRILPGLAKQ